MKAMLEALTLQIIGIMTNIFFTLMAAIFALLCAYATFCTFTGDGIIAALGALGAAAATYVSWNLRR